MGLLAEHFFVTGGSHIDIVAHIVLTDPAHFYRIFLFVVVQKLYGIALADPEIARHLFVYDDRVVCGRKARELSHFPVAAQAVRPRIKADVVLGDRMGSVRGICPPAR